MTGRDPRVTFARPDLADAALRGEVEAAAFAVPQPRRITASLVQLRPRPDAALAPDTELLFGEPVRQLAEADGWAWVQSALDGYVGYLPTAALGPDGAAPTHAVATLGAQTYPAPELKRPASGGLPFAARVTVTAEAGDHLAIGPDTWVPRPQLRPLSEPEPDWVAVAARFEGVPYIWGGRSSAGLDCSALVQLSRQAAGFTCPRDSDMQAGLGRVVERAPLRGNLIFWRGHVGIMLDEVRLLHANAHHMAVAVEPLAAASARIEAAGGGPVTRHARLDDTGAPG